MSTGEKFKRVVDIMEQLRAPGGCPWDREQTFDSIKPYTLEETYEVFEAIENRDWKELPGELGDLLLQVLFYAQMAKEEGYFSIDDVTDRLADKLVHRHPHVFADVDAKTTGEVLRNWEALKKEEKREQGRETKSILAGVSRAMPPLLEAAKLTRKAAEVGFDWPNLQGIFDKLAEESEELKQNTGKIPQNAISIKGDPSGDLNISPELREKLADEVGDLFFVVVNLARHLGVDAEAALRGTNRKFRRRFTHIEDELRASGKKIEESSLEEMELLWQKSKRSEAS